MGPEPDSPLPPRTSQARNDYEGIDGLTGSGGSRLLLLLL